MSEFEEANESEPTRGEKTAKEREMHIRHLKWLARLMDDQFELPLIRTRIGWDGIIGLLPATGDLVALLVALYIVIAAWRLGASKWTVLLMLGRIVVDALLGAAPIVGDVFDIAFKANVRNLKSMGIDPSEGEDKRKP